MRYCLCDGSEFSSCSPCDIACRLFLIVVVRVMLECGMRVTAEHIDASFDSDACGVPTSTLVAFFFYVVFVT